MTAPSQHEVPKVLKAAVIIMGVLLVVGFGALVVTIAVKANKLAAGTGSAPTVGQTAGSPASMTVPFDTNIDIPDGMEVLGSEAGGEVVLIRVGQGNQQQIIVVDARNGETRGVITLK